MEGILLEELIGVDAISSLHDSVFCVHLQRQYSAARELNAFLEKYGMDVKNITEDSELKYLQALEVRFARAFLTVVTETYTNAPCQLIREEPRTRTNSTTTI